MKLYIYYTSSKKETTYPDLNGHEINKVYDYYATKSLPDFENIPEYCGSFVDRFEPEGSGSNLYLVSGSIPHRGIIQHLIYANSKKEADAYFRNLHREDIALNRRMIFSDYLESVVI